jgi:hypothetical protein
MLILKALALGPLHGYGIGQRIAQISGDELRSRRVRYIQDFTGSNTAGGSTRSGTSQKTISARSSTS